VRNGYIVLLHDGGGDRSQTVAAVGTIITTLQARGYRFDTL
jgi:peptidoglycan/xylan/chitin deacetylase (PgdA/CDA1 family)